MLFRQHRFALSVATKQYGNKGVSANRCVVPNAHVTLPVAAGQLQLGLNLGHMRYYYMMCIQSGRPGLEVCPRNSMMLCPFPLPVEAIHKIKAFFAYAVTKIALCCEGIH